MRGKEATNQAPEDSSNGEIGIELLPHAARPVHLLARHLVMQDEDEDGGVGDHLVIEESIDERRDPDEAQCCLVLTSQLLASLHFRVAPDSAESESENQHIMVAGEFWLDRSCVGLDFENLLESCSTFKGRLGSHQDLK